MGSLLRFPLSAEFVARFPTFIETGYGDGRSMTYAAQHDFTDLYSVELWPDSAKKGRRDFADDLRVNIVYGNSSDELVHLLHRQQFDSIFFWLDAHYPGMDHNNQPLDAEPNEEVRLPLVTELQVIREMRPDKDYFILIDDLRFYSDLAWGDGPIPAEFHSTLPKSRNLNFLDPFISMHRVEIDLHDSGYALIGPIGGPFLQFKD